MKCEKNQVCNKGILLIGELDLFMDQLLDFIVYFELELYVNQYSMSWNKNA